MSTYDQNHLKINLTLTKYLNLIWFVLYTIYSLYWRLVYIIKYLHLISLWFLSHLRGSLIHLLSNNRMDPIYLLRLLMSTTMSLDLRLCRQNIFMSTFPMLLNRVIEVLLDFTLMLCNNWLTCSLYLRSKLLFRTYNQ